MIDEKWYFKIIQTWDECLTKIKECEGPKVPSTKSKIS